MSTDFTLAPHDDHLYVSLAPGYVITPGGLAELMVSVSDVCARRGLRRVLVEGTIAARRMGTMDSFSAGSLAGSMMPGAMVACCFYGYRPDELSRFFQDVTQNRGVRIEFFADLGAARAWLGLGSQP